jgi:hypothetical protein
METTLDRSGPPIALRLFSRHQSHTAKRLLHPTTSRQDLPIPNIPTSLRNLPKTQNFESLPTSTRAFTRPHLVRALDNFLSITGLPGNRMKPQASVVVVGQDLVSSSESTTAGGEHSFFPVPLSCFERTDSSPFDDQMWASRLR